MKFDCDDIIINNTIFYNVVSNSVVNGSVLSTSGKKTDTQPYSLTIIFLKTINIIYILTAFDVINLLCTFLRIK